MAGEWYFAVAGQRRGPVDTAELRRLFQAGGLSPTDLVWREGMAKWAPLSTFDLMEGGAEPPPQPMSSAGRIESRGVSPRIYYRKLYSPDLVKRWESREFTSVHNHGEPPEWSNHRLLVNATLDDYPLSTHYGKGMALPSARDKYYAECVQRSRAWSSLASSEQMETVEQAGVFAFACTKNVYWYGGKAEEKDRFAVFYGLEVCGGPEPESYLVAVIKPISMPTREDFVALCCGGVAPQQPSRAQGEQSIDHNPRLEGLSWIDEVES
jgi:hypothetical protein